MDDMPTEWKDFVNDKFNWSNANYKLVPGDTPYDTVRKTESLYWTPDDIDILYKINSMGYRSDEFLETRDIVFAGCSMAWGDGLVYKGIWGNILSNSLGMKSYNLGIGGKSTQFIVQNSIAFFKKYGKPKVLFCLFPEFTRMEMKSTTDFMTSKNLPKDATGKYTYSLIPMAEDPNKFIKYSKMPHFAEDLIPSELAFAISLDYIKMLETYCKLNDIKLFWGTWDKYQEEYLSKNIDSMEFENYVYLGMDKWEKRIQDDYVMHFHSDGNSCYQKIIGPCLSHDKCHEDLKNIYGKNFDFAMDTDVKNKVWGHLPVHVHVHMAEAFEEAFKNDGN